jgi:hypothetical protein
MHEMVKQTERMYNMTNTRSQPGKQTAAEHKHADEL